MAINNGYKKNSWPLIMAINFQIFDWNVYLVLIFAMSKNLWTLLMAIKEFMTIINGWKDM